MSGKIVEIKVTDKGGVSRTFTREFAQWLFIADEGGSAGKIISLSGSDTSDAYLLRILENAVVQTMNETNRMRPGGKEGK